MSSERRESATLAGGCFWCLEAIFAEMKGVEKVVSGYAGGTVPHPSYEQVCSGETGHAEVVQITFDPQTISLSELIEVFFAFHDPTTLNRQGPDVGSQYRSAIFYTNSQQKVLAEKMIAELTAARVWDAPIVTRIEALTDFYAAEEYHMDYFKRNPRQAYCQAVVAPKVAKARQHALARTRQSN